MPTYYIIGFANTAQTIDPKTQPSEHQTSHVGVLDLLQYVNQSH